MHIQSEIIGHFYEPSDMFYCKNHQQAFAFRVHGAELYDVLNDLKCKKLIYVFDRAEVTPLIKLWDKHELEY